jgi:hypothetical protein
MTDKHVVFNSYSFANERVTRDLTIVSDPGSFLDFDKGTDFGVVSDFAAIEIYKIINFHISPELHIRRYSL